MLTPLNQQQGPSPAFNPPTFGMTKMAPTPPMAAKPAVGNPATPFAQPSGQTPTRGIGAQMAAQGRGPDTALVHMSPGEVSGLNALAQATGNRGLTINPATGLPEAGILSSILPMVLGAVLSPFITPIGAAAVVGAGAGLMEHSLTKGLMAGLSAFGGAGLGGMVGSMMSGGASALGSAALGAAPGALAADTVAPEAASALGLGADAASTAAPMGLSAATTAASGAASALPSAAETMAQFSPEALTGISAAAPAATSVVGAAAPAAASAATPAATQAASTGLKGLMQGGYSKFGDALQAGATHAIPGTNTTLSGLGSLGVPRALTTAAGAAGVMNSLSGAMTPDPLKVPTAENKYPYMGPYKAVPRTLNTPPASRFNDQGIPNDSSEFNWFSSSQPNLPYAYETQAGGPPPGYPGYVPPTPEQLKAMGYAKGGIVSLKPGGFVMDARSVSELGNGSSSAGKELLKKHGGEPIDGGKGDGVSDDIPAKIKGGPQARVARDEVKFSPKAVRKLGGPQKLYALVDAAHRARASAGRGQDTGLRRGLA